MKICKCFWRPISQRKQRNPRCRLVFLMRRLVLPYRKRWESVVTMLECILKLYEVMCVMGGHSFMHSSFLIQITTVIGRILFGSVVLILAFAQASLFHIPSESYFSCIYSFVSLLGTSLVRWGIRDRPLSHLSCLISQNGLSA